MQDLGVARRGAGEPKGALEKSKPFFKLVPSLKTGEQRLADFFMEFVLPIPARPLSERAVCRTNFAGMSS